MRLPPSALRAAAAALAGVPLALLLPPSPAPPLAPARTPRRRPLDSSPLLAALLPAAAAAPIGALAGLGAVAASSLEEELRRAVEDAFRERPPALPAPAPYSQRGPPPLPGAPPPGPSAGAVAQATVWRIAALNGLVWAAWQLPHAPTQRVLERWFLSSPAALLGARFPRGPASALLSTYSHSSFLHLAANMAGLLSFGPILMAQRPSQRTPRLTQAEFLALYTAAGVGASVASSLFMAALGSARPALGASGSIFGVMTYFTLCAPDARVLLLFVFEMSSSSAMLAATAVNAVLCAAEWRASRAGRQGPMVDGMAHLAGTAVGAAGFALASARARQRGEPEAPAPGSARSARSRRGSGVEL